MRNAGQIYASTTADDLLTGARYAVNKKASNIPLDAVAEVSVNENPNRAYRWNFSKNKVHERVRGLLGLR